ncbi:MAG: hypothetical protein JNK04_08760, partial [Myxococcales bacterium]|nr:hypothetical protein [Myxococcales bacterium]
MMRYVSIALSSVLFAACATVSPTPSQPLPSGPADASEPEPTRLAPSDRVTPPAPASARLVDTSALSTPGRLRLGHYATRDGLVGLVIDRSGAVPLARVDGSRTVLELAVRRSGSVTELLSLEEEVVITIDVDGRHSLGRGAPEM